MNRGLSAESPRTVPQPGHGGVHSVLEIDKRVCRPKLLPQFFPRHNFVRPLQQHDQNLKGLFLHANPGAAFAEFTGAGVQLKNTEANDARPIWTISYA